MKILVLASVLTLSASAFADSLKIDMTLNVVGSYKLTANNQLVGSGSTASGLAKVSVKADGKEFSTTQVIPAYPVDESTVITVQGKNRIVIEDKIKGETRTFSGEVKYDKDNKLVRLKIRGSDMKKYSESEVLEIVKHATNELDAKAEWKHGDYVCTSSGETDVFSCAFSLNVKISAK